MSQKKQNLILTSLQIRKNINGHYVSLQLDLATLYWSHFFLLVQSVKCEISFIWIAVLWRQVHTKTVCFACIMPLYKYFCPTFQCYFRCLLLFKLFQSTSFKKKTALFAHPLEMKYSLDVFEAVKTRTASDLSLVKITAVCVLNITSLHKTKHR